MSIRVGQRVDCLLVEEQSGTARAGKNRTRTWVCRCDCGKSCVRTTGALSRKKRHPNEVRSCGCKRQVRRLGLRNGSPQDKSYRFLIGQYKHRAKARGHKWNLDTATAINLFSSNCHYCGQPPNNKFNAYLTKTGNPTPQFNRGGKYCANDAWITYNGIDRVDNELGYDHHNVVSACAECNYAKWGRTEDEFVRWITRLVTHQFGVDLSSTPAKSLKRSTPSVSRLGDDMVHTRTLRNVRDAPDASATSAST